MVALGRGAVSYERGRVGDSLVAGESPAQIHDSNRGYQHETVTRKVDVRLPGKGNSNSHGTRPVHLIITMISGFGPAG